MEILAAIVQSSDGLRADLWLMAMALLAFAAFLWCDELIKLCACDVSFAAEHMTINLPKSKTDQYRDGYTVIVAQLGSQTCSVAILERYFERAVLDHGSTDLVFRMIVHTKSGEHLRKSGGLSYS